MDFNGFSKDDFNVFYTDGLEERMTLIREKIQPKFKEIGEDLTEELSVLSGEEMFLHIAQHARRKKNPPNDTWLAIAPNKRGYKMLPHFQVGLFDDHVFVWLAYIYELPNKEDKASTLLDNIGNVKELPRDFMVSLDHTQKNAFPITDEEALEKGLERFRDVKKGEFLIGKQIMSDDPLLKDGDRFLNTVKETFETLMPLYKL
ncbi:YktB family protein [Alteribacter aurantiacus]|uniref:YktB family protein n=1 Tax=Alteribacter aurantiacus TaxID=254410 RepID=UPI0004071947|nr:DUF1054 domain-containing protein [Alteribacter aurantiacus]